jgi:hypothetical protein
MEIGEPPTDDDHQELFGLFYRHCNSELHPTDPLVTSALPPQDSTDEQKSE